MIKNLDSSLSVESHKRLRKKNESESTDNTNTKPHPILVTLSTVFDRRKILSLARNLKSCDGYRTVFIKKALTVNELKEITELRKKCTTANEILLKNDSQHETKYSVIDGKIRRLFRVTDTNTFKVDWTKVFQTSGLPKN